MEYEWNDAEKEDLAGVCSAVTANFPALRDVEVLYPKIGIVFCKTELANSTILLNGGHVITLAGHTDVVS
jgi:hypothetical protein